MTRPSPRLIKRFLTVSGWTLLPHVFVFFAMLVGTSGGVSAQERCPIPEPVAYGPLEDIKDAPAYYWSNGVWFRMPLGYLNPQGPERMIPILTDPERFAALLAVNDFTGYDAETGCFDLAGVPDFVAGRPFSFWYPSGNYIPFDLGGPRAVFDCPTGTCDPARTDGRDRFSVFFRMEWGPAPGSAPVS